MCKISSKLTRKELEEHNGHIERIIKELREIRKIDVKTARARLPHIKRELAAITNSLKGATKQPRY